MLDIRFASATDPGAGDNLQGLNQQLAAFYAGEQMRAYYALAHSRNVDWKQKRYHRLIRPECRPGMEVLDLGCGSAHGYVNLQDAGIRYLGVDWSEEQIERNRGDLAPAAEFRASSLYDTGLESDRFDLVFSLFTLEHLVFPHRFLREAMRLTKPGAPLIILCPNFRPFGRIPSLDYGGAIAPLKDKLRHGRMRESAYHLFLRTVYYPVLIRRKFPRSRYPFLINLAPSCLRGTYYPDNDAVYFVDRDEVRDELLALGSEDITPKLVRGKDDRSVCFVAVRKRDRQLPEPHCRPITPPPDGESPVARSTTLRTWLPLTGV
jgi:ubiquinone/menaquinone biosynthesis C-methylase UbiE